MANVFYSGQRNYIQLLNGLWDRASVSLTGASNTSVTVGTGLKSFTTDTQRQWSVGAPVVAMRTSDPSGVYMYGTVSSYDEETGALVLNSTVTLGTGTFTDWTITVSGVRGATGATGAKGDTGDTGPTGPTGPANTLTIGTVTTGAAGSSASSTITGTAPNQTLNLTIPRGDTGATGATGAAGLVWRGAWVSGTTYALNDAVTNAGSSYRRKVAGAGTTAPGSDATNWELIALKGTDGAGTVNSVNNISPVSGNVTIGKTDIGLGSVDNTPDTLKPISTAQQTALDMKLNASEVAAISQSLHSGAIVDAFLYDTSKDSDGGAWRKRCAATSWYNEAINGTWLGQKANELAARGDNLWTRPEGTTGMFSVSGVTDATATIAGYESALYFVSNSVQRYAYNTSFVPTAGTVYAVSVIVQMDDNSAPVFGTGGDFNFVLANTQITSGGSVTHIGGNRYSVSAIAAAGSTSANGGVIKNTSHSAKGFRVTAFKLNKVGELSSTYSASPELVSNGGFDAGTSGWVPFQNGILSVDAGRLCITNDTSGASSGAAYQAFTTVVGKTYVVQFTYQQGTSGVGGIRCGTLAGGSQYQNDLSLTASATKSFAFTATTANTVLTLYTNDITANRTAYFDNISVKEVTTLATPYVPYSTLAGQYYQNTTDGKFYALNSTYGQTETFRGNVREFPALAGIVAESGRVVVYDLSAGAMWMVFKDNGSAVASGNVLCNASTTTALCALNGQILVGGSTASNLGYSNINLIKDGSRQVSQYSGGPYNGNLAQRNAGVGYTFSTSITDKIISGIVNDITATVLPGAPVDPATGLPVPTIAVGTAGGVSVIKDNGTVVNGMTVTGISAVAFRGATLFAMRFVSLRQMYVMRDVRALGASFTYDTMYSKDTTPAIFDSSADPRIAAFGQSRFASGCSSALDLIYENQSSPTKGMRATISNAYNSGWQVGDIRGVWLADTVAETIAASGERWPAPTFDTSTGLTLDANWSISGGVATSDSGSGFITVTSPPLTVGKTYVATLTVSTYTGGTLYLPYDGVGANQKAISASGTHTHSFVAANGGSLMIYSSGFLGSIDNVSVKLASPDRSVKNNGLVINGSLTKAAVASGSQLVGFSGFSASNYLEQPYNSQLDFGTGDFCYLAWIKPTGDGVVILERGNSPNATGDFTLTTDVNGNLGAVYQGVAVASSTLDVPLNVYSLVGYFRRSGKGYFTLNGIVQNVDTGVGANITSTTAKLRIGLNVPATSGFLGSIAMVRASATAPSDDQIAHIYRTELAMFQPSAKVTIDGTSTAVTALAYDEDTELLHVGTSWGRSAFKDLVRVESEATTAGSINSISASEGGVLTGGASSGRYAQPAIRLRDELKRQRAIKRTTGHSQTPFWFTADGSGKAYTLPIGVEPMAVYRHGLLMRDGSSYDYTTAFDGFRWTVTFVDTPTFDHNICIMGVYK